MRHSVNCRHMFICPVSDLAWGRWSQWSPSCSDLLCNASTLHNTTSKGPCVWMGEEGVSNVSGNIAVQTRRRLRDDCTAERCPECNGEEQTRVGRCNCKTLAWPNSLSPVQHIANHIPISHTTYTHSLIFVYRYNYLCIHKSMVCVDAVFLHARACTHTHTLHSFPAGVGAMVPVVLPYQ